MRKQRSGMLTNFPKLQNGKSQAQDSSSVSSSHTQFFSLVGFTAISSHHFVDVVCLWLHCFPTQLLEWSYLTISMQSHHTLDGIKPFLKEQSEVTSESSLWLIRSLWSVLSHSHHSDFLLFSTHSTPVPDISRCLKHVKRLAHQILELLVL